MTFFGLIHSEGIGLAMTPKVAISYLLVAVMLYGMSRYAKLAAKPAEMHHPHAMSGDEVLGAEAAK